jgi:membrane-anchored protein YejM (alkaline phosphatase superfamily)
MPSSRRTFLRSTAIAALPLAAQPQRPNILFIQTDDQRFDDLGCYGNPVIQTPNIDRLAATGVRFRNHFVATAICCCSRACIITGQNMTVTDRLLWRRTVAPDTWIVCVFLLGKVPG